MRNKCKWMIVGGAGYIGSHVSRCFIDNDLDVVIVDNLVTGIKQRIPENVKLFNLNCENHSKLKKYILENKIDGIVHLAAFKQARESCIDPLKYWDNNVRSTLGIVKAIKNTNVRYLIFSSSCSVYGQGGEVQEDSKLDPISPYGWTKFVSEQIIQNCADQLNFSFISLRYFNVIGNDNFPMAFDNSEECLVPKIYKAIINKKLPKVFGTDFETSDGTAIRDYIDVRDLSYIHFLAAKHLMESKKNLNKFFNVGSGKPVSVLEIINSFSRLLAIKIMYEDVGRNPADPSKVWANNEKFFRNFGWQPKHSIDSSIKSFLESPEIKEELDKLFNSRS
ncbi:UDP-glucose 4-epimerase GalE [Prochlorococcus marinus]|uniref:UDP-glucose 4-epimerase GalE n=1 Tax=Prochlorococcus marinus TaxID=1219 RepID=UPI001ADC0978|nr:UDP-glucose 4-epimerase GalE [Prochlorococcus marinus]MBO8221451.1 UDP-glucose 4-epimerase GalE [Prochlorococcus marinus CUG1417]MBW3074261.1 UDP-glucose 4-epimerase GalE [Prochlorococcus marinus str. MU1417]